MPGRDEAERRLGHQLAHDADALPRVLGVRAHRHRHVRAAREVDRVEADAVHHGRDLGDHRRRQRVGAPEALVPVAHRRVDEPDHAGRMRKSTSPYCDRLAVRAADLGDDAAGAGDDGAHQLHDLEDADLRALLDRRCRPRRTAPRPGRASGRTSRPSARVTSTRPAAPRPRAAGAAALSVTGASPRRKRIVRRGVSSSNSSNCDSSTSRRISFTSSGVRSGESLIPSA